MAAADHRRARPPLGAESLAALGLRYVERFATTRAKLRTYLERKVRERGWGEEAPADLDAIVERFARSGYVDDGAYAIAKSRSLSARGYGPGRVRQALKIAGVEEQDSKGARALANEEAVAAALRFARRRRIGPFADAAPDPRAREKAIGALHRAGHGFGLARAIVEMEPGAEVDADALSDLTANLC